MRVVFKNNAYYDGAEKLLTVEQMAAILNLSIWHIRKLARDRRIPRVKIKNHWMFNERLVKEAYFNNGKSIDNEEDSVTVVYPPRKRRTNRPSAESVALLSLVEDL